MTTETGKLRFLDPTVAASVEVVSMAPRLESLEGKVVGLLDNSKGAGRVILDDLGIMLKERYGVAELVNSGKPTLTNLSPSQWKRGYFLSGPDEATGVLGVCCAS